MHDEDVDPPPQPDVFVLRNLTWTKIHSMQIGLGVAILIYWSLALGRTGTAFGLAVMVALAALGLAQERSERTQADHGLGFHDVREKPWYALSAALATYVAMGVLWGWPPVV